MNIDRNTDQCWSKGIHFIFFISFCSCPHYLTKVGFFTCLLLLFLIKDIIGFLLLCGDRLNNQSCFYLQHIKLFKWTSQMLRHKECITESGNLSSPTARVFFVLWGPKSLKICLWWVLMLQRQVICRLELQGLPTEWKSYLILSLLDPVSSRDFTFLRVHWVIWCVWQPKKTSR